MLRILTSYYRNIIQATDGDTGFVHEFLFEEDTWTIKYVIVTIGNWLTGSRVLVPVEAIGRPELSSKLPINLTKTQIENSPKFTGKRPPAPAVLLANPVVGGENESLPEEHSSPGDLHGTRGVVGCDIEAGDELIGQLDDFILDDEHWRIRYLVIGARAAKARRHILVSSSWVKTTNWLENRVKVDLRRESVERSPDYNPSMPVDREYEVRLYDYYFGRPFNNDAASVPKALLGQIRANSHAEKR